MPFFYCKEQSPKKKRKNKKIKSSKRAKLFLKWSKNFLFNFICFATNKKDIPPWAGLKTFNATLQGDILDLGS